MTEYLTTITAKRGLRADAYRFFVDGAHDYDTLEDCIELFSKNGFSRPLVGSYVYYLAFLDEIVAGAEVTYPYDFRLPHETGQLSAAQLEVISVHPRKQNQHLGRALIQVIINDASQSGKISEIIIPSKLQASHFYDHLVDLGILSQKEPLIYVAKLDS